MKPVLLTLIVLLTAATGALAEGIDFFHGTWKEALAEAQKQEKIIFVDAYAVWCGPCKRMAAEVFTDKEVGDFYNANFINVKMDMERGEGLEFRKKYPVQAFPTLFYIDYNGELVHAERGARPADAFIDLGRQALGKVDRSGQFAEAYEQGDRSPELVYNYVKALNRAGKPNLKIVNDYLRDQQDLTTEQNLLIIFEGATEADSKVFEYLLDHKKRIEKLTSEEAVRDKIRSACQATVRKGIEYSYRELIDQAIAHMKKHDPARAEAFTLEAEMDLARAGEDAKAFAKACRDYAKKVAADDAKTLHELALNLLRHYRGDAYAMKEAEEIAAAAAKKGNAYGYYLTYGSVLLQNGKKDEARKAAGKALELAKAEGGTAVQNVERFQIQLGE